MEDGNHFTRVHSVGWRPPRREAAPAIQDVMAGADEPHRLVTSGICQGAHVRQSYSGFVLYAKRHSTNDPGTQMEARAWRH